MRAHIAGLRAGAVRIGDAIDLGARAALAQIVVARTIRVFGTTRRIIRRIIGATVIRAGTIIGPGRIIAMSVVALVVVAVIASTGSQRAKGDTQYPHQQDSS